jgi:hypothetical protein
VVLEGGTIAAIGGQPPGGEAERQNCQPTPVMYRRSVVSRSWAGSLL